MRLFPLRRVKGEQGKLTMKIKHDAPSEKTCNKFTLKLLRFMKNCIVDFSPMVMDTPETNRT